MYIVVTHARTRMPGGHAVIVEGTGKEGNSHGNSRDASFSQPMGICTVICVELDKNTFLTDTQADTVKLII